jgi:SAM-dependent methyltransferase
VDLEEYRRTTRQAWGSVAPAWERWRAYAETCYGPVREWLLRELAPQPGDTVLELSAGGGETGLQAAVAVGDTGRLISTDFAPEMVEASRRRGAELGVGNAEYRVMDAEHLDLADASVDRVLCRFGYMLMADTAAAFGETRRVLRAGGRLAFAVWGPGERNPWATIRSQTLIERGYMEPPEPGAPGPFTMGSEERTRGLLEQAGFRQVRLEEVPVRLPFPDVDAYVAWGIEVSPGFAAALAQVSGDERASLQAEMGERLAAFATPQGYELPGVVLCAVAE